MKKRIDVLHTVSFWFGALFASFTFAMIAALFGRFDKSGRIGRWSGYWWSKTILYFAGVSVRADLSALDLSRNYVYMVNHASQLDIWALYVVFTQRVLGFVAKESLFRTPIIGAAMKGAGHVPVDRGNSRKAMRSIDEAAKIVNADGRSIVIFPEGTRGSGEGPLQDFKLGGMIMALKCRIPVAPIVIRGAADILPTRSGAILKGPRTLTVTALPPIDTAQYTVKDRERFKNDLYAVMNAAWLEHAA